MQSPRPAFQYRRICHRARFSRGWRTHFVDVPAEWNEHAEDHAMIGAALAAGLYPKLLVVDGSTGGLKTITNNAAISIVSAGLIGCLRTPLTCLARPTAPYVCQLPHASGRLCGQLYRLLYHHAVEEGVSNARLGRPPAQPALH